MQSTIESVQCAVYSELLWRANHCRVPSVEHFLHVHIHQKNVDIVPNIFTTQPTTHDPVTRLALECHSTSS